MKRLIMIFGLFLAGIALQGLDSRPLEVIIEYVKDSEGQLMVGLFNTEETFTSKPWRGEKPGASKGTMHVYFNDIPPGSYAIAVYHDANQNSKMDKNLLGIPKEGYGFSNDVKGSFGPPSFDDAKIQWTGTERYTIHLTYPK